MAGKQDAAVIIKKHGDEHEHGHHGGAWKVAYADFVTAMMAFFLLLWLLNATSEEQKKGIADYFDPNISASSSRSGSGGVLGGTTLAPKGAMTSDSSQFELVRNERMSPVEQSDTNAQKTEIQPDAAQLAAEQAEKEEETRFKQIEESLREVFDKQPELRSLQQNLLIDRTGEGLRIQLIDQQNYSMFERGSAYMTPEARHLVAQIVQVVNQVRNKLSIRGHTDARPFVSRAGYDNWNLSSDRALDTRLALLEGGLDPVRIANVAGLADTDPLVPDTLDARNRRMSIILLREAPVAKR
jgi:chemotaxis protein MotB